MKTYCRDCGHIGLKTYCHDCGHICGPSKPSRCPICRSVFISFYPNPLLAPA